MARFVVAAEQHSRAYPWMVIDLRQSLVIARTATEGTARMVARGLAGLPEPPKPDDDEGGPELPI
jgi:hypothetical protein